MFKVIAVATGLLAFPAFSADISIRKKDLRCQEGRISTEIEVKVENETFEFNPSCSFSFSKDFSTKSGKKCEVRAGMCSSFSPKNQFQVKCNDGKEKSISIDCAS